MATREHVVTDQGNGGAYCSKCLHDLTAKFNPNSTGSRDLFLPVPNPCPGCGESWTDGGMYVGAGGSDF